MLVFTHLHRCVIALYTQYFPESCENNHMHKTRVGFEPMTKMNIFLLILMCFGAINSLYFKKIPR